MVSDVRGCESSGRGLTDVFADTPPERIILIQPCLCHGVARCFVRARDQLIDMFPRILNSIPGRDVRFRRALAFKIKAAG